MINKIKKVEDPHAKVSLHLYVENWVKNLIPDDKIASQEIAQFIIARWGAPRKALEQIIIDIQKKKEERLRVESELMALEHRREEMDLEQQRREEQLAIIENNKKYARYVLLKEILTGPVISKQKAIMLAYGVKVTGEVLGWATMARRKFYATKEVGVEFPVGQVDPRSFLNHLEEHYIEAYPGISYVGKGEREKEKKQEFTDVMSETKKVCSLGHVYDTLKDKCPDCSQVYRYAPTIEISNAQTIYLRFQNGEYSGYFSDQIIADGFKKLEGKIELIGSQGQRAIGPGDGGAI